MFSPKNNWHYSALTMSAFGTGLPTTIPKGIYERKADVLRSRPGDAPYLLVIRRTTRIEYYIWVVHRGLEAAVPDT